MIGTHFISIRVKHFGELASIPKSFLSNFYPLFNHVHLLYSTHSLHLLAVHVSPYDPQTYRSEHYPEDEPSIAPHHDQAGGGVSG